MKTILVVNDDGINSPGIRAAAEVAKGLGRVVVVAPAVQQSGVGRSMSLFTPVGISRVRTDRLEAYSIDGTPVDAVIVGMYGVLKRAPDLLISGINMGENMSSEATTSGTVGAAMEGASQGIPSIAISIQASSEIKFEAIQPEADFSLAVRVLKGVAMHVLEEGLPEGVDLLNINVPERAGREGIKVTRLARRMYTTKVQERFDPRGRPYFWIDGDAIYDAEEDTDVYAVRRENRISVTPLSLDFTATVALARLKGLEGILL